MVLLNKYALLPLCAIATVALGKRAFPRASAKGVRYAIAALLVIDGVADTVYGGGIVIGVIKFVVIAIAVTVVNGMLRSEGSTASPA